MEMELLRRLRALTNFPRSRQGMYPKHIHDTTKLYKSAVMTALVLVNMMTNFTHDTFCPWEREKKRKINEFKLHETYPDIASIPPAINHYANLFIFSYVHIA